MKDSILNQYAVHYEYNSKSLSTKLLMKFLKEDKIKYLRINCIPGTPVKVLSDLVIPIRKISGASNLFKEKIKINEIFLFKLMEYKKITYGNISEY